MALADELQVDVLFVGAYGRKGQKSILGSTASGALRNSACSVCLVRRPPQKPISTPTTWCVAVDGGRASLMGERQDVSV